MKLRVLNSGKHILEFSPDESEALWGEFNHRFGPVKRTEGATHAVLKIGEIELLLLNDWGEPCLMAMDVRGESLLRGLAALDLPHSRAA